MYKHMHGLLQVRKELAEAGADALLVTTLGALRRRPPPAARCLALACWELPCAASDQSVPTLAYLAPTSPARPPARRRGGLAAQPAGGRRALQPRLHLLRRGDHNRRHPLRGSVQGAHAQGGQARAAGAAGAHTRQGHHQPTRPPAHPTTHSPAHPPTRPPWQVVDSAAAHLAEAGVEVRPYERLVPDVRAMAAGGSRLWVDPTKVGGRRLGGRAGQAGRATWDPLPLVSGVCAARP